jgi:hypothetical protein
MPLHNTEKRPTFCHNWTGVPKNGVRSYAMQLCQFMVSEKKMGPIIQPVLKAHHTHTIAMCTDTSWFNVISTDHYLLF